MEHSHEHGHSHAVDFGAVNQRAFIIGIALNVVFVIAEVIAGFIYNSIALLTDAGHNASDVATLVLSLVAFKLAQKKSTDKFTYGYKKTTILAALTNAVILLVAIGILGYESVNRLQNPNAIEGHVVAWVAGLGILVNSVSAFLFFKNKEKDLNIKSAYLHLLADALVSVGVVAGGIVMSYTDWYWLDPAIGLIIMIIILFSTWSLLRDSFKMAIDAVPEGIDLKKVEAVIKKVNHVKAVEHIHVWPLSTTENALTAHVTVDENLSAEERKTLLAKIKHDLKHLNIHHTTIELHAGMASGTEVC